jgi:hypothetical protein
LIYQSTAADLYKIRRSMFPPFVSCGVFTHHGEEALLGVLELEVLIRELLAVNGLATSSVTVGEITTLDHELLDDTVEGGALVSVAILAGRQLTALCEHAASD